jgi:hypothetical protein
MENGKWQIEIGKSKMEKRKWKIETGNSAPIFPVPISVFFSDLP